MAEVEQLTFGQLYHFLKAIQEVEDIMTGNRKKDIDPLTRKQAIAAMVEEGYKVIDHG